MASLPRVERDDGAAVRSFLRDASLRAGATHVLLEPPGAATAAGLRELAAVCEAKDAPLYVAFDLLRAEHVAQSILAD